MSNYQQKVTLEALQPGMYVCKLDCAWHQTPFPLQGFHIRSQQDVDLLKNYCKFVFIDVTRTRDPEAYAPKDRDAQPATKKAVSDTPLVARPIKYTVKTTLKKELKQAKAIYADLTHAVNQLQQQFQSGSELNLRDTMNASKAVVHSVLRNPEAMIWIVKLKQDASSLYQHAMNCAVWAAVLGREIGLSEPRLEELTTSVMLSKIGLMYMTQDKEVNFARLRKLEQYQKHVLYAIKLLTRDNRLANVILEAVATHEERYDGTGFPSQLSGEDIPLFGQIAGLVDYYECATNPVFCDSVMSPTEALGHLYNLRNKQFSERLVQAFIQTLGLYPPGTIVELNSDEVAIVTSSQREKRLQPDLLVVLDRNKKPLRSTRVLDLQAVNQNSKQPVEIVATLPIGSFGVLPHKYQYAQDSLVSRLFG